MNTLTQVHESLRAIRTRPLFVMQLDVSSMLSIGETPEGVRRVGVVPSGRFAGERLSGTVLDGGSDWQRVRVDAITLDVRLTLKTNDEAMIGMSYRGVRHGPAEVLARMSRGESVSPDEYYFRITPTFETAAPQYDWLNRVVALGIGDRRPEGPVYSIFEVL